MTSDEFKQFIEAHDWTTAKSYPDNPHEYIVRARIDTPDSEFFDAVRFIRENGHPEKFYSKTYIYYRFDGKKYWTMGAAVEETTVINRTEIEEEDNAD